MRLVEHRVHVGPRHRAGAFGIRRHPRGHLHGEPLGRLAEQRIQQPLLVREVILQRAFVTPARSATASSVNAATP